MAKTATAISTESFGEDYSLDDWNNPYVFKSAKERNDYFKGHVELLKTAGVEYYGFKDGVLFSPLRKGSLKKLQVKEEITNSQYSIGCHYHFCTEFFNKSKGMSLEVIDCAGGNAEAYFALRRDAGRFLEQADKLCSPLELRLLQGVCGRNESIKYICTGGGRQYSRGYMALISALKKMDKHFGDNYCSYV